MRAIVIDKFREAGSVRQMPDPQLAPDAVLIEVTVAGVNPIDWKTRAGEAGERPFPLVLGQDFAGVARETGTSVRGVRAGDRVFGCAREHGSYAGLTLVPEGKKDSPIAVIPEGVSDDVAAALPTPGLTALGSLDALDVGAEMSVLVIGAAGAVGSIAVQLARERGANVTAVVQPGQGESARRDGASEIVETSGPEMLEAIRTVHPEPFEAVLDLVNKRDAIERNAPLYAKGGRFVTTIHVADEAWFREREVSAINLTMYETEASSSQSLRALAEMVARGTLRVEIAGQKALTEAAAVLDGMQSGKLRGKFVLRATE